MPQKSSSSVQVFYSKLDRAELLRLLRAGVGQLQAVLPLRRVVLFGSYARGTYTVASDVDLLVVYAGEPRPDAYALTKRVIDVPRLEPHLHTEAEYAAVRATVDRMVEDGVVLLEETS